MVECNEVLAEGVDVEAHALVVALRNIVRSQTIVEARAGIAEATEIIVRLRGRLDAAEDWLRTFVPR